MTESKTTQTVVTITPSAVIEIKRLMELEKDDILFLRLGVAAGGCSGMSYSMSLDTEKTDDDLIYSNDGFEVLIASKAAPYLAGTVLDFKGGMLGGGFNFENPNAKRSCGCGTSFSC